jgi:hypothetical protein
MAISGELNVWINRPINRKISVSCCLDSKFEKSGRSSCKASASKPDTENTVHTLRRKADANEAKIK